MDTTTTPPVQKKKSPKAILADVKQEGLIVTEIEPGIYQATSPLSSYIIEYDKNKCIGAASCSIIAEFTFFMNEENKADFVTDAKEMDSDDNILEAAQSCPVLAIRILDKATGEVLFPIE